MEGRPKVTLTTAAQRPGVTVITVVRNARATLERTIRSVLAQRGPDVDYLVMDGDSSDGTLDVIRAFEGRLRWISEPDRGLYDAMNKGVQRVTDPERYVMFLNADDTFAGEDALDRLLAGGRGEDLLYGRIECHDEPLDYREVVGRELDARGLLTGMIPHQALACRRRVFDVVGGFDLRYRIAADYDWLTRAYQRPGITRRFVPEVVAVMAGGGLSERLYTRLVRERWDIVRRRRTALDLAAWTAVAILSEIPRYHARRTLRGLGMLNPARGLKRRLLGGAPRPGAPRPAPGRDRAHGGGISGLLRPLIAGPARHVLRLLRDPEYRTLARLETVLGGRPRFQPCRARAHGWELAVPDAASFLSSYHEIFVEGHYAFPWPERPLRILDLGANIGLSVMFFKRSHPQAEIVALEPDPGIFACLERNVRHNGVRGVELLQRAAWTRDTRLPFRPDHADGGRAVATGGGQGSVEVEAIDIAAFVGRRPFDVIKMDIEGAEAVVVPALRPVLGGVRYLMVEYHSVIGQPQSLAALFQIFEECGFRVHAHSVVASPRPFVELSAHDGYDLILHLFAWRP